MENMKTMTSEEFALLRGHALRAMNEAYQIQARAGDYYYASQTISSTIDELTFVWDNLEPACPDKVGIAETSAVTGARKLIWEALDKLKEASLRLDDASRETKMAYRNARSTLGKLMED